MKRVVAEKYREFDFSRAKRGPVIKPEPGMEKPYEKEELDIAKKFVDAIDGRDDASPFTVTNPALIMRATCERVYSAPSADDTNTSSRIRS